MSGGLAAVVRGAESICYGLGLLAWAGRGEVEENAFQEATASGVAAAAAVVR